MASLAETFRQAVDGRDLLWSDFEVRQTDCYRLFRGGVDGIHGWIVDRFGALAWIQWREGECSLNWDQACELAAQCQSVLKAKFGVEATFLKRYVADRSRLPNLQQEGLVFEAAFGAKNERWLGRENGVLFKILPTENFSPGLFLDQRNHRDWVRNLSSGRRVLNLFAYTGAFSVFAAKGGASEVVTVDVSKKWLETAKENFALNELHNTEHRCYATGALGFLQTGLKRAEHYDLVLIDPPSFSRSDRDGVFSLRENRTELWRLGRESVGPKGIFFFSCNWQQLSGESLIRETLEWFPASQWQKVELPGQPNDFLQTENPIAAVGYRRK
jgi:23S rRNA (cytosine1962-C5)-methyltransferase